MFCLSPCLFPLEKMVTLYARRCVFCGTIYPETERLRRGELTPARNRRGRAIRDPSRLVDAWVSPAAPPTPAR